MTTCVRFTSGAAPATETTRACHDPSQIEQQRAITACRNPRAPLACVGTILAVNKTATRGQLVVTLAGPSGTTKNRFSHPGAGPGTSPKQPRALNFLSCGYTYRRSSRFLKFFTSETWCLPFRNTKPPAAFHGGYRASAPSFPRLSSPGTKGLCRCSMGYFNSPRTSSGLIFAAI